MTDNFALQPEYAIMALNRHGFRERRLSGSLNTTPNDRRWPPAAPWMEVAGELTLSTLSCPWWLTALGNSNRARL
jgi:hypothetical protein